MTDNPYPLADLESTVELLWHYCTGVTPDTPEIRHLARALLLAVEAGRRLPRLNDKTQGPLFSLDEFIEPSANSPQP